MQPISPNTPASASYTAPGVVIDTNVLHPPADARILPAAVAPPAGAPNTWADYFASRLGNAMGYAWIVSENGELVDRGASGQARAANDQFPELWSPDVMCNLASVSKTIAAVAIMTQVQRRGWTFVDEPAWTYLSQRYTTVRPGKFVEQVSLGDLLTMTSGLTPNSDLNPPAGQTVDEFLAGYLARDGERTPGHFYYYSNTSFTILQVLYEILLAGVPGSFATLVGANILAPLGANLAGFATTPGDQTALSYTGRAQTTAGHAWPELQSVGAGGWIASATAVMQYMNGLETNLLLDPDTTDLMCTAHLGWYPFVGQHGVYYHHNGGLTTGGSPAEGTSTGVMHFVDGFDAVLLVNSPVPNIISIMAGAFDATR